MCGSRVFQASCAACTFAAAAMASKGGTGGLDMRFSGRCASGSGGPAERCEDRPVDVDLSQVVEVVGEDVDRDVAYRFRDLGVGDAGSAGGFEGLVVDVAAGADDGVGEGEHGMGVR